MIRINYHITEAQAARLRATARRTGLSVAELVRRAIDAMFGKEDEKRRKDEGKPA